MPELDGVRRLTALREEIAELDLAITELVGRRNSAAREIGGVKRELGMDTCVPAQEGVVIARYIEAGEKHGVSRETCEALARTVMEEAKRVQKETKNR